MKKRILCFILAFLMSVMPFPGCAGEHSGASAPAANTENNEVIEMPENAVVPEQMKILCIGNSFSVDTIEHAADILISLGVKDVKVANLYMGGCSINRHLYNAQNDILAYEYTMKGNSTSQTIARMKISTAIKSDKWDWISIQHGTGDGSRYAEETSYVNLDTLVKYIRSLAHPETKIAFNLTWVGEANSHPEMIAYGNDQLKYFLDICALTANVVVSTEGIDMVCPTGTAIQNARTANIGTLTRDKYHLTYNLGRYIAGLTFIGALTGLDISNVQWTANGMDDADLLIAIKAAAAAINTPFEVTDLSEGKAFD